MASDQVYDSLLADLICGAWPADARLKASDLSHRYDAATGAVREALIRLAAEGFVRNLPNRGFRTINGDRQALGERAHMRITLEVEGARRSIERGDLAWEANLSAAHHRLTHLETRLRASDTPNVANLAVWTAADQDFHVALISACGSDYLISEQRRAFTSFRLHLNAIEDDWGYRGEALVEEHAAILEAALNRDAEACAAAIRTHFEFYPTALAARPSATAAQ